MSDQQQNQGTLVNVKRVRKDADTKGRDKLVLTFGTDKDGNDGLEALITALEQYRGKQVNFDIRVEQKESAHGKFDTAFVIVKEMIPKGAAPSGSKVAYVPKQQNSRAANLQAKTQKIREDFKG